MANKNDNGPVFEVGQDLDLAELHIYTQRQKAGVCPLTGEAKPAPKPAAKPKAKA